jgi:hypothetical protein
MPNYNVLNCKEKKGTRKNAVKKSVSQCSVAKNRDIYFVDLPFNRNRLTNYYFPDPPLPSSPLANGRNRPPLLPCPICPDDAPIALWVANS